MSIIKKNNGNPIVYKSLELNSKADSSSRIVSMYLSSFNTLDSDCDIIRKGAFLKSITERGPESKSNRQIKFLHQHSVKEPIGVFKTLLEDNTGLYAEAIVEKTPFGDVVLERYLNGTYKEHSIGFQYVWDKCQWIEVPNNEGGESKTMEAFECRELNLFEGSTVTFGANENTPFLGFKGSHDDIETMLEEELKFLIKNAPNFEYELQLRQLYAKQKSLVTSLAELNTKEKTKPIISNNSNELNNNNFYLNLIQ